MTSIFAWRKLWEDILLDEVSQGYGSQACSSGLLKNTSLRGSCLGIEGWRNGALKAAASLAEAHCQEKLSSSSCMLAKQLTC